MNDQLFRSGVSIYQGMAVNFLYMLFRFMTAARYASVWFFSMAIYYMVLCIMPSIFGIRVPPQRKQRGRL